MHKIYAMFATEFGRSAFDFAICAGLLATPYIVLVAIFAPKVITIINNN